MAPRHATLGYLIAYLTAIVAANLLTTWLGPWMSTVNAFLFIGLDITARDELHDAWQHRHLWWRMPALIAAGSLLSWLFNRRAAPIALASFVAFAVAGLADTLVYSCMRAYPRLHRVNTSNFVSSFADSLIFPTLAFGWPPDPWIVYAQFTAKVAGGLLWSLILPQKATQ